MRDAADGAQLVTPQTACDGLARSGCAEGLDAHCSIALGHVVDAGLEPFDLACMASAQSKSDMRKCTGMTGGCL